MSVFFVLDVASPAPLLQLRSHSREKKKKMVHLVNSVSPFGGSLCTVGRTNVKGGGGGEKSSFAPAIDDQSSLLCLTHSGVVLNLSSLIFMGSNLVKGVLNG